MQDIFIDRNAENAGLKANEKANIGNDKDGLRSSGYGTNHLIKDKLSFYSEVLKSDRPNLSEKPGRDWIFSTFK
ncbi:hypothetical protein [Ruegeria sp. HKCCA4633]|uniref:hypothetical protein n=1 Tax=Ruegeria sp. HKCCA4633 TaxID=2682983 RepID=UPI001487D3B9|nr:hypothetical protein [Ruegeria sp. HKCCA4633]